jgi:hypothetical protein
MIGYAGFRFGLWSPAAGLFNEYGFIAPKEIAQLCTPQAGFQSLPADREQKIQAYIRDAFDQLLLQLSKEKLEELQLSGYAQVVWVSEQRLSQTTGPIAAEHASSTGIEVFHLDVPLDEAVVGGLLLGSFAFCDTAAFGASVLPPADLARDLLVLADTEQDQRRLTEEASPKARDRATPLLAPPVAVTAVASHPRGLIVSEVFIGYREAQADAVIGSW